jgi:hypothetical protein
LKNAENAIEANPYSRNGHFNLARCHEINFSHQKALDSYSKCQQLNPRDEEVIRKIESMKANMLADQKKNHLYREKLVPKFDKAIFYTKANCENNQNTNLCDTKPLIMAKESTKPSPLYSYVDNDPPPTVK